MNNKSNAKKRARKKPTKRWNIGWLEERSKWILAKSQAEAFAKFNRSPAGKKAKSAFTLIVDAAEGGSPWENLP